MNLSYQQVLPPSIIKVEPVIQEEASEIKNIAETFAKNLGNFQIPNLKLPLLASRNKNNR